MQFAIASTRLRKSEFLSEETIMIFEAKMSNEEFLLLREEIYKYAGIDFQESQKRMLQSKMLKRHVE